MRLKDIINSVSWPDVWYAMMEYYPDQEQNLEGYHKVFHELLEKDPTNEYDMDLVIKAVVEDDDHTYYHVYGLDNTDDTEYAIDFMPWSEWVNMKVPDILVVIYPKEDIVAHCLWEMTFCGYHEEEIQAKMNELKAMVEDIKNKEVGQDGNGPVC
jgi:hypothetical protein